ncbi:FmdB family zinc ribbon protein [Desulfonatronum sp. SC1]|uniref:FmdB family zinc ribbon protein n=1 Tax=Desulfonatronum sp. SC1 TaxID=2109626 RepID=UPI000D310AF8|nr:FmdB family transcriptional regulator [Desulfonatronum sp. SC1]
MPIHEYTCASCGKMYEAIQIGSRPQPGCPFCGAEEATKVLSVPASGVGSVRQAVPGPKDHGCCGERPGQKGCTPGSCCGRS